MEAEKKEMWYQRPLKVLPTRVRRTYRGGKNLDLWHGALSGEDGDRPEEWLASVTEAVNPGFPPIEREGLSKINWKENFESGAEAMEKETAEAPERLLRELIEQEPEAMLGAEHCKKCGAETGVLAKLLDPVERLSIQVHPDRAFAKEFFHSDYGKTECWHVISTREVQGEMPYLLMGFRPGVTREMWEALYRQQDIPGMVDSLNRIIPEPGDTYLVPGGLPHAIGPGLCMLEIQEPTDYTMRSERTDASGKKIPDALIHQGLGEALLMECFHYDEMTETDIRNRYQIPPKEIRYGNGSKYSLLIGPERTECFSMEKAEIKGKLRFHNPGSFTILIVLSGSGKLCREHGWEEINPGDQFFVPASADAFVIESQREMCTIVRCYPPGVEPLPPEEGNA